MFEKLITTFCSIDPNPGLCAIELDAHIQRALRSSYSVEQIENVLIKATVNIPSDSEPLPLRPGRSHYTLPSVDTGGSPAELERCREPEFRREQDPRISLDNPERQQLMPSDPQTDAVVCFGPFPPFPFPAPVPPEPDRPFGGPRPPAPPSLPSECNAAIIEFNEVELIEQLQSRNSFGRNEAFVVVYKLNGVIKVSRPFTSNEPNTVSEQAAREFFANGGVPAGAVVIGAIHNHPSYDTDGIYSRNDRLSDSGLGTQLSPTDIDIDERIREFGREREFSVSENFVIGLQRPDIGNLGKPSEGLNVFDENGNFIRNPRKQRERAQ